MSARTPGERDEGTELFHASKEPGAGRAPHVTLHIRLWFLHQLSQVRNLAAVIVQSTCLPIQTIRDRYSM